MDKISRKELIKKYIEFFKSKGHKEIPNSSLVPENDPTVLFTTAGMHPLVPFLLGQPHPSGKRLVNVQRCIRTGDIDTVGDTTHHTFFEMLGNWSLGDYWKKEAIEMTFEFHTKILKIPAEKYAVTCFSGNKMIQKDEESEKIWKLLGVAKDRIAFLEEDNFWQLPGAGPCGPCTEQFYWKDIKIRPPKKFNPEDKNWVEIGNDVLMQYEKDEKGNYELAKQKNIDFGGGVERTIAVLNGLEDNYLSDCWQPIIKEIETLSKRNYSMSKGVTTDMRIIADHIKASVFIIADGVTPSNVGRGYVLRRLIRRAMRYGRRIGLEDFISKIAEPVFRIYEDYKILTDNKQKILQELIKEEERFNETIEKGLMIFNKKIVEAIEKNGKNSESKSMGTISGKEAFLLYQSFGFPIELVEEEAKKFRNLQVDKKGFYEELSKHQELSRTASSGQFKSGLADNSEATTKLHTAAHLLNQALRTVLNKPDLHQKGSNITPERLRFDFNFDRKLTEDELKKVEELVNKKIKEKISVLKKEVTLDEARKLGAQGIFEDKYSKLEKVFVYTIADFSREICAGPHVKNTSELGKFKITKEESSGSGIRRIKAILE